MVNYGLVSVGVLVEPETSPETTPKPLTIGLNYTAEMSDLKIKVCEDDNDSSNDESDHPDSDKSGGSGTSGKRKAHYRTLERVESDFCDGVLAAASITTRNRPSCRKTRSEAQLLYSDGQNKAFVVGIKNPSPTQKHSCEYYRQKLFLESLHQGADYPDWMNIKAIQKTAGQKVVQKLTAQQKSLEAEAEQQRKKIMQSPSNSGSDVENSSGSGSPVDFLPPKKKPGRLEPMPLHAIKTNE